MGWDSGGEGGEGERDVSQEEVDKGPRQAVLERRRRAHSGRCRRGQIFLCLYSHPGNCWRWPFLAAKFRPGRLPRPHFRHSAFLEALRPCARPTGEVSRQSMPSPSQPRAPGRRAVGNGPQDSDRARPAESVSLTTPRKQNRVQEACNVHQRGAQLRSKFYEPPVLHMPYIDRTRARLRPQAPSRSNFPNISPNIAYSWPSYHSVVSVPGRKKQNRAHLDVIPNIDISRSSARVRVCSRLALTPQPRRCSLPCNACRITYHVSADASRRKSGGRDWKK